jgi:hypothetical protein
MPPFPLRKKLTEQRESNAAPFSTRSLRQRFRSKPAVLPRPLLSKSPSACRLLVQLLSKRPQRLFPEAIRHPIAIQWLAGYGDVGTDAINMMLMHAFRSARENCCFLFVAVCQSCRTYQWKKQPASVCASTRMLLLSVVTRAVAAELSVGAWACSTCASLLSCMATCFPKARCIAAIEARIWVTADARTAVSSPQLPQSWKKFSVPHAAQS